MITLQNEIFNLWTKKTLYKKLWTVINTEQITEH